MEDIWKIAGAVITSLGGGALIIGMFSTWLGKVWASRILEQDRAKYQAQLEGMKSDLNKSIHRHNVAASRIDTQRADAIQQLYVALIRCNEVALDIMKPNVPDDFSISIPAYTEWANKLRVESEQLEKLSIFHAIYLREETSAIVSKCGMIISNMSIEFCNAVFNNSPNSDPNLIMEKIESAKFKFKDTYEKSFKPARSILLQEFRAITDPT